MPESDLNTGLIFDTGTMASGENILAGDEP